MSIPSNEHSGILREMIFTTEPTTINCWVAREATRFSGTRLPFFHLPSLSQLSSRINDNVKLICFRQDPASNRTQSSPADIRGRSKFTFVFRRRAEIFVRERSVNVKLDLYLEKEIEGGREREREKKEAQNRNREDKKINFSAVEFKLLTAPVLFRLDNLRNCRRCLRGNAQSRRGSRVGYSKLRARSRRRSRVIS